MLTQRHLQVNFYDRANSFIDGLNSNRIDLQIQALRNIEIEFLEYEDDAAEKSWLYSFIKYEKKAPKSNHSHRIATKKELINFLEYTSKIIINLVVACPHEELLRHSIPIIIRLCQNKLLPNDFFKKLYQNAERLSGPIVMRAQDLILRLFNKLSSEEKKYFKLLAISGSENSQIESLHFLCKLITAHEISIEVVQKLIKQICKNIQQLESDVFPIIQIPELRTLLRKSLLTEYLTNFQDTGVLSALKIIAETDPFESDVDDIKQLLDMSILNETENLKDVLINLAQKNENLFSSCLLGMVRLEGFNETTKWLTGEMITDHIEDLMKTLLNYNQLPEASSSIVRNTFIQYNVLITKGIRTNSNNHIIFVDYNSLIGKEILWDVFLKKKNQKIEHLLMKIYQGKLKEYVIDALHAFMKNPQLIAAEIIEKSLKDLKQSLKENKEGKIKLKQFIKLKCGIPVGQIKVKSTSYLCQSSEDIKQLKYLSEEVNNKIKQTKEKLETKIEIKEKEYLPETPVDAIVTDILASVYEQKGTSAEWIKRVIKNNKYFITTQINNEDVSINDMVGDLLKKDGSIFLYIQEGVKTLNCQKLTKSKSNDKIINCDPKTLKQLSFIIEENEIKNVIELIQKKEMYSIGITLLKEINPFIKWRLSPIENCKEQTGYEFIGFERLMTQNEIQEDDFKELISMFCHSIETRKGNEKYIAEILLHFEKLAKKELWYINEEQIKKIQKRYFMEGNERIINTICDILLLRNNQIIEWNKEVVVEPIKRVVKELMNQELFETLIPYLEEPSELVEECYEIIIQYIDIKYNINDLFIQKMIENITNRGKGFKFSIRAMKLMKDKQKLLQPYLITFIDSLFPKGKLTEIKEDTLHDYIEMICESCKTCNEEQKKEICHHFDMILSMLESNGNHIETRKGLWCGLTNQGSTCYMNSILQQLLHTKMFCNKLLEKKVITPKYFEDTEENKNQKNLNIISIEKFDVNKTKTIVNKVQILKKENGAINDNIENDSKEVMQKIEQSDNTISKTQEEIEQEINSQKENIQNKEQNEFITHNKNEFKDYRMIEGLQKLFVEMKESKLQTVNTKEFCKEAHGSCYEEINVYEQMDAQEFFNTIISTLEICKKEKNIIEARKIFTGETEISIKSQCGHIVKRNEEFCSCALEVEHYQSIGQSLKALCEGCVLCDYRCEQCGLKSDAQRSEKYKKLPETLVFHLKRFGYNEQFQIVKYNGKFEYPNEIDMKQYCCKEYKGITKYKLVGIVIHTGSAYGGHYFSNILLNGQWISFNDKLVENIGNGNWFGGEVSNAYMLFYQQINILEEKENETFMIDELLLKRIEKMNYSYVLSKQASKPFVIDFIKGINESCKYIGNTLSFIRTIILKRNPEQSLGIFEGISQIMNQEIAREVLQKISTYYLKDYLIWGKSMIISAIKQIQEPVFNELIIKEVENGNSHGIEVIQELYKLMQVKLSTCVRLSVHIIKNQKYNYVQGKIACSFILEGIQQKIYQFDKDILLSFKSTNSPESLIQEIIEKYPTQKVNECALKLIKSSLNKREINDEEMIKLKRLVCNVNCAVCIVNECLKHLCMAPDSCRYFKIILITMQIVLLSPLIYNELKKKIKEFNENLDFYSLKIVLIE
ncbi:ubiquitin specific protease, putative [Entamoeba dispar SAW760]|uniref:Ubiquitin specific protease, putative n=1 Tax=Entamoeba dispar (strain ATCC PRA-260 / SAW760) TaxID=370354 RepID=B0EMM7_ENTDS|nr:ubiquitin specific protease, putative [Entamoeba dispar SAW760]EDR24217.1 ubiquitin specific protease, putative [Entamoeba dispar SAW760]|eukprot:EDR24217.1 ubiquitin specific protease, putative [Entamoeba dispar SAW760]